MEDVSGVVSGSEKGGSVFGVNDNVFNWGMGSASSSSMTSASMTSSSSGHFSSWEVLDTPMMTSPLQSSWGEDFVVMSQNEESVTRIQIPRDTTLEPRDTTLESRDSFRDVQRDSRDNSRDAAVDEPIHKRVYECLSLINAHHARAKRSFLHLFGSIQQTLADGKEQKQTMVRLVCVV